MREVRFCLEYRLVQDGRTYLVPTAWMVDSLVTRAQIEEMIERARVMTANATWWIEERDSKEEPCD